MNTDKTITLNLYECFQNGHNPLGSKGKPSYLAQSVSKNSINSSLKLRTSLGVRIEDSSSRQGISGSIPISCTERRSEEHTSELQSRSDLVCRLLLEKKKKIITHHQVTYYAV